MKIIRDIWLCSDCMPVAVNGDYSHLDYSYEPRAATRLMHEINAGLAALPGLVPDFGGEDPEKYECRSCGFEGQSWDFPFFDGSSSARVCPECDDDWVRPVVFDNGEEEFSRRECDCCGTDLGGSRFRFAQLVEEDRTS